MKIASFFFLSLLLFVSPDLSSSDSSEPMSHNKDEIYGLYKIDPKADITCYGGNPEDVEVSYNSGHWFIEWGDNPLFKSPYTVTIEDQFGTIANMYDVNQRHWDFYGVYISPGESVCVTVTSQDPFSGDSTVKYTY